LKNGRTGKDRKAVLARVERAGGGWQGKGGRRRNNLHEVAVKGLKGMAKRNKRKANRGREAPVFTSLLRALTPIPRNERIKEEKKTAKDFEMTINENRRPGV